MMQYLKPLSFTFTLAIIHSLTANPAQAATIWIGNWTLTAPEDVTDLHILVRFEDSTTSRPRPRKLDKGPFGDVNAEKDTTNSWMTQIDWKTKINLLGDPVILTKGTMINIGFKIESHRNAPRSKPPVIEEAYWTFNDKKGTVIPSTDLPFVLQGQDPLPEVPLPASWLSLSAAILFLFGLGKLRRHRPHKG